MDLYSYRHRVTTIYKQKIPDIQYIPCNKINVTPSLLCLPAVATTVMVEFVMLHALFWRSVRVATVAAGSLSCRDDSTPPSGR